MPPQNMGIPGPPTNPPPGPGGAGFYPAGPPGTQGQGQGQDYAPPQQYGMGGVNSNPNGNNMQGMGMGMGMPPPTSTADMNQGQGQGGPNQQRPQAYGTALFGANQSWGAPSGPDKNQAPGPNQGQGQQNFDDSTANFANSLPLINEMDLTCECNPQFMQASVGKMVVSQSAATASKIPIGIVIKPMAGDKGAGNDQVDVVDFGTTGIIRCKRCRTYINPYVTWTDNGRRWKCNTCGMLNDVPTSYFSHLDNNGQRRDRDQRYE